MINIIFPKKCPACGGTVAKNGGSFCEKCARKIKRTGENACMRCGKPIENSRVEYCNTCIKSPPAYLTKNKSVYVYEGGVKEAMYRLKYSHAAYVGKYLAGDLFDVTEQWVNSLGVKYIVPVPVSRKRLKKRGYNQADIIAGAYVKSYNKKYSKHRLELIYPIKRAKNTLPQKELSADIRRKNLKKAFKLDKSGVELERMYDYAKKGGNILLVDDIYTTGATLDTMAKLLLNGNFANRVYSITLAIGRDI